MQWLAENWETICGILGAIVTLATLIVGMTPSTRDDNIVRRFAEIISFLKPSNAPGQPLSMPGIKPARHDLETVYVRPASEVENDDA
jgi:hypothetical protein